MKIAVTILIIALAALFAFAGRMAKEAPEGMGVAMSRWCAGGTVACMGSIIWAWM